MKDEFPQRSGSPQSKMLQEIITDVDSDLFLIFTFSFEIHERVITFCVFIYTANRDSV